jgi:hypothetical protein
MVSSSAWSESMSKLESMSAAVREVIDAYPAGHAFYGNQLKDDVVRIYPSISYNTPKTPKPLSDWIGENGNFFTFSQNIFEKSLSLPHLRRDYFSMSSRANIWQPGKPVTKRHSIEAEGELYDDYSRKTQRSF